MIFGVTGVDPGLVNSGVVTLKWDTQMQTFSRHYLIMDRLEPDLFSEWVEELHPGIPVVCEAYRPRANYGTDPKMSALIHEIKLLAPKAMVLQNQGVKKIVTQSFMELWNMWTWPSTNHNDLRSAARIGLYYLFKQPQMNKELALATSYMLDDPLSWKELRCDC